MGLVEWSTWELWVLSWWLQPQDFKMSRRTSIHYWVEDGWKGTLEHPVVDPGMHGEAPWHLVESFTQTWRDGWIYLDRKLTCAAASHYGLWLGRPSVWLWTDGASRCRRTVGTGWVPAVSQRNSTEDFVSFVPSSNIMQSEDIKEGAILAGKVHKTLQSGNLIN
jgi:hypothetical protein